MQDKLFISQFALNAADAIEKARLSREMVLRMVELAELRDPFETSQHAKRVGAYSVELYEKWAARRGISAREIRKVSDVLRTAAILHDVGKVAVSDVDPQEARRAHLRREAARCASTPSSGARLFKRTNSFWDYMSAEVALNHHENWDGTGYPGQDREPLRGEDLHGARASRAPRSRCRPGSSRSPTSTTRWSPSARTRRAGGRSTPCATSATRRARSSIPSWSSIFLKMDDLLVAIAKKYSY